MWAFLLAALTALAPSQGPQRQELLLAGRTLLVEADDIQVDAAARRVYLVGRAAFRVDATTFRADQILIDYTNLERPAATATGHVVLDDPERGHIVAERLRYDFAVSRGEFQHAEITVPLHFQPALRDLMRASEIPQNLVISAAEAAQVGNELLFRGAAVTHSDSSPPEYQLRVDQAAITVGEGEGIGGVERLKARGVRVQLYGKTVLGLPNLDLATNQLLIPRMGVNSTDGFFVEHTLAPFAMQPFRFTITPRLGTDSLLTGRARLAIGSPVGTFDLVGSLKERQLLISSADPVQYSRLPELGWSAPKLTVPGLGGTWTGRLTYGLIDEERNLTTWRTAVQTEYTRTVHRGATSRVVLGGAGRYAWYATGHDYGWLRGSVRVEKQFSPICYIAAGVTSHYLSGATPFLSDTIEAATQLEADTRWRLSKHWLIGNGVLVDLTSGVLKHEEYSLWYRDRLLEYGVNVVTRPSLELNLDLRVLGF